MEEEIRIAVAWWINNQNRKAVQAQADVLGRAGGQTNLSGRLDVIRDLFKFLISHKVRVGVKGGSEG